MPHLTSDVTKSTTTISLQVSQHCEFGIVVIITLIGLSAKTRGFIYTVHAFQFLVGGTRYCGGGVCRKTWDFAKKVENISGLKIFMILSSTVPWSPVAISAIML